MLSFYHKKEVSVMTENPGNLGERCVQCVHDRVGKYGPSINSTDTDVDPYGWDGSVEPAICLHDRFQMSIHLYHYVP